MALGNNCKHLMTERRTALHSLIHLTTDTGIEKVIRIFLPMLLFKKRASALISRFSDVQIPTASVEYQMHIQPYSGNNPTAISLRNLVLSQAKEDIEDIIVHGSLADDTDCNYSDFDCLIILKEDILQYEQRLLQLANKLWKWQKLMLKTDILQHHGWFLAFTSDFKCWDLSYLPAEVFSSSKSLLRNEEYEIKIFASPSEDFKTPFLTLCNSLMNITPGKLNRMNSYELKTFISRFFLMPALYYQARYEKGIYKKDSFIITRKDFSENLWRPVEELSSLRLQWKQQYSSFTTHLIETFYLWPSGIKKFIYPQASKHIKLTVLQNLAAIKLLLQAMKKNID